MISPHPNQGLKEGFSRMGITVVIPTCDREPKLRSALDSVFRQSLRPREILVIDNGCISICDRLSGIYPNAEFVRIPPRAGVAVARNWGAMLGSGVYLAFLDDDDVWPVDYLATMVAHLEATGDGLVAAPNRDLETEEIIAMPIPIPCDSRLKQWRELAYMGSNMVMRADDFWSAGGFPARLVTGEDRALVIRMHLNGVRISRCLDTFVLRNMEPCDRLTSGSNLLMGKLSFLEAFRDEMPRRDRHDDQLSFLIYLSKSWGWPIWLIGVFCVPAAAFRRLLKYLRSGIPKWRITSSTCPTGNRLYK
ncbi:MAG: hypothetical protein C1943_06555 [Halochromatium sp.]|nr:hypothetical protein [Halochromatium sp.]